MIRLTCQRHTDQIWKESEVTQYSSGNDGWNSTPKRWGCWDIFYLKDISDIRSIISIRSMFYRAKALWEVLEQNKENFNPGSFIIKISRCTLLSFLCGMLGFEMEDGSPPGVSLNSHQRPRSWYLAIIVASISYKSFWNQIERKWPSYYIARQE